MGHPSQGRLHALPSPGLVRFASALPPGEYLVSELYDDWLESPDCDDEDFEDVFVFRYALRKAGLEPIPRSRRFRRPE